MSLKSNLIVDSFTGGLPDLEEQSRFHGTGREIPSAEDAARASLDSNAIEGALTLSAHEVTLRALGSHHHVTGNTRQFHRDK